MAYIGRNLEQFSNVEKLDVITPATATGAGPYNLTQNSTAFTPVNANSLVISIDGVVQYGNFTVNEATVTFDAALSDANTCDFIYQMGIGLISTPADGTVTTAKLSLPLPSIAIDWESKSADFTAAAGKAYFCDTTSNDIDVTLPSPTIGDTIRFLDATGTFDTNDLTILNGSSKIQGASANLDVSTERAGFALVYYNSTQGWLLTDV